MTNVQKLGAALVGTIAGAWIGRAILKWLLGLDGAPLIAGVVVFALAGAAIAVSAALEDRRA